MYTNNMLVDSIRRSTECLKFHCDLAQKFCHNICKLVAHSVLFYYFNYQKNKQDFFTNKQECI